MLVKVSNSTQEGVEVEVNEDALEQEFLEMLKVMNRVKQTLQINQDQLEEVEGSLFKRIKDTDFYYDTVAMLIVDKVTLQPLKDMDDVQLFKVINRAEGLMKISNISP
jgi:hypothetical protein